jgi:ABC-type nitrate/sulfonate/bicarbonate transport system permease component
MHAESARSNVAPAALAEVPVRRSDRPWTGYLLILLLLVLWELASDFRLVDPFFLPPVRSIAAAGVALVQSGDLLNHLGSSAWRLAVGYGLGVILAIAMGLLIGYYREAHKAFSPLIELLRPLPSAALIPVAILFLGIGDGMKIFIIAWAAFFPVVINTSDGVRGVDTVLLDTARTFQLTEWEIFRSILIPATAPQVVTGMRVSLGIAIILVVISEMVAGNTGIGYLILNAQRSFAVAEMFAAIFVLVICGYALSQMFIWIERRKLRWHYLSEQQER